MVIILPQPSDCLTLLLLLIFFYCPGGTDVTMNWLFTVQLNLVNLCVIKYVFLWDCWADGRVMHSSSNQPLYDFKSRHWKVTTWGTKDKARAGDLAQELGTLLVRVTVVHFGELWSLHQAPLPGSRGENVCHLISRTNSDWLPGMHSNVLIVGGVQNLSVTENGCGAS